MDSEETVRVIDGSQIHGALSNIIEKAPQLFKEIDGAGKGFVSPAEVKSAAASEAAALLLGSRVGVQIFDHVLKGISVPSAEDSCDQEAFAKLLREYLTQVASVLQDQPLVVSILDGSLIKKLLEDEDEFAMLAESVFEELDADESGKLSRSELGPAVMQLGLEQGVPPPAAKPESDELISKLLAKYAGNGSEELGLNQFAALLQEVLQDLANSLSSRPIYIVQDVKVINGSHLRKILEDEKLLAEVADSVFQQLDEDQDGKLSKAEIRPIFETQGSQWGLPSPEENADVNTLYTEIFKEIDRDHSGKVDKDEFHVLAKALFEGFSEQLRIDPILVNVDAVFQ